MKKLSFLALAAVGLLFGACSSDKDVAEVTPKVWTGEGEGYLSLNIQLPTQSPSVTRAANDIYDDGLNREYLVKDAVLILFQKATADPEGDATFVSAQAIDWYDVKDDGSVGTSTDNLTNSYKAAAQIYGSVTKDELLALVCLNYTNVMSVTANHQLKIGATDIEVDNKFTKLLAATSNADFLSKSASPYFFMTNTVYSTKAGGESTSAKTFEDTDIHTLASLDKSKIKPTKAEALADPAGDIYVERGVAKATLSWDPDVAKVKPDGETALVVDAVEWYLNNLEPASYVVRNMGTDVATYFGYSSDYFNPAYNYRMVGNTGFGITSLHTSTATMYRTYWCKDPNYAEAAPTLTVLTPTWSAPMVSNTGVENPQYCYENTFSVANQNYKNTTRAVLKVKLNDSETFYNVNGGNTRYKTVGDAESFAINSIVNNSDVYDAFQAKIVPGKSYNITAADFKVTFTDDATTKQHKVATIALKTEAGSNIATAITDGKLSAAPSIADFSSIIAAVNSAVVINKFEGGIMYYTARIEHFANTAAEKENPYVYNAANLAPWNVWEVAPNKPGSGSTAASYPGTNAEKNYLGRYGMVRNNWYDIEVTSFNHLGEPIDPSGSVSAGDTPDDNPQEYISVKIHVLSWAKRTQQWSF
jgi:hypothetical protein